MSTTTEIKSPRFVPTDIAHVLESSPQDTRKELWQSLSPEEKGDVLPFLHDEIKESFLKRTSVDEITSITDHMQPSDVADVIDLVPVEVGQEIVDCLSEADKKLVEQSLEFADDVVGRWLKHDAITVSQNRAVAQVIKHIRSISLPAYTDKVLLIDSKRRYKGAVALASILEASDNLLLSELPLVADINVLDPNTSLTDLAAVFRIKHFISAPVVDSEGVLLGRITGDDAISVLQDEADRQFMNMAGLDEDSDLFAPVLISAKRRAVWLGINLLTAFLASFVIGQFEATLEQVVALAVLMPIVASMGGVAGSQTLTIVIRGLALKNLHSGNTQSLLKKELGVASINGVIWALAVGVLASFWFSDPMLGMVISTAILINLITAAYAGLFIPVLLDKLNIDPALSGSVILTTVTDVVGFLSFLSMGAWLLT